MQSDAATARPTSDDPPKPATPPTMGGEPKRRRRRPLKLLLMLLPTLLLPLLFLPRRAALVVPLRSQRLASRITIGIKTYACDATAPALLAALLRSVRNNYPSVTVLIANDGPLPLRDLPFLRDDPAAHEVRLPLDAGISVGRNAMVERASTPLFLLLDDDHLLDPGTDLSLLDDVRHFDIVGLRVRNLPGIPELEEKNIVLPRYIANITSFENRVLELCVWDENAGPGVSHMRVPIRVDVLHNAFIARVDALKRVRWRDELKVNEHMSFFLDSRNAGLRVGYLPSVYVHHRKRHDSKCYEAVRGREQLFEQLLDYRDEFAWTKGCYKTFPAYVRWHLSVMNGLYAS